MRTLPYDLGILTLLRTLLVRAIYRIYDPEDELIGTPWWFQCVVAMIDPYPEGQGAMAKFQLFYPNWPMPAPVFSFMEFGREFETKVTQDGGVWWSERVEKPNRNGDMMRFSTEMMRQMSDGMGYPQHKDMIPPAAYWGPPSHKSMVGLQMALDRKVPVLLVSMEGNAPDFEKKLIQAALTELQKAYKGTSTKLVELFTAPEIQHMDSWQPPLEAKSLEQLAELYTPASPSLGDPFAAGFDIKDKEGNRIHPIDPVCVVHGKKMAEHACLYCCLCFKSLTPDECNVCEDGQKENVCKPCAAEEKEVMRARNTTHELEQQIPTPPEGGNSRSDEG